MRTQWTNLLAVTLVLAGCSASPARNAKVQGRELAFSGNALTNGDFETGDLTGWTSSGSTGVGSTAHTGSFAVSVGSSAPTGDSAVTQQVTLPAGSVQLSFWYQVNCPDQVQNDWASAQVLDTNGNLLVTALPNTCTNDGSWQNAVVDLSAFAGQTVVLSLANHDDGNAGDPTFTLWDDVVIASTPAADAGVDDGGIADGGIADAGTDDGGVADAGAPDAGPGHSIKTVFIIMMENHNWSSISGSASAPYINNTLLPQASHAEQYFNAAGIHPSEPNYLWLEAGTNFGILNDSAPSANHQSTTQHLVTLLESAGISWKSYQENISGTTCPLTNSGLYAPKHNPMVFFDDVTDGLSAASPHCIAHVRPYTELASDLQNNTVPNYVFITPNLCNDMHNSSGCATSDAVSNGDTWLSNEVPKILASSAYQSGGALFITWDESEGGDFPVGMIVLSPFAKGGGYSSNVAFTHASMLRTTQEVFGVSPFLGAADGSNDLSDLFQTFP